MRKRWFRVVVIAVLILLPVGIGWFGQGMILRLYRKTQYPQKIRIAAGSEGGRYRNISDCLKKRFEEELGVKVEILPTQGALDNLLHLRADDADFALYQPGTLEVLREHHPDDVKKAEKDRDLGSPEQGMEDVAFVANLYLQPSHFIVRSDAGIERPDDLIGQPVSVGLELSGDYAMSLVLLDHFGLEEESILGEHLDYQEIERGFANGSLDAAFNTVGRRGTGYGETLRDREVRHSRNPLCKSSREEECVRVGTYDSRRLLPFSF